ncbi:hypothetical protein D3C86_2127920 [compost metagenome]
MTIETLQVVHQRIRRLFRCSLGLFFLGRQPRHTHFIGDNLHCHRQVQRAVFRVRGNRHVIVTFLQFVVGQTHTLTAKHQRNRR